VSDYYGFLDNSNIEGNETADSLAKIGCYDGFQSSGTRVETPHNKRDKNCLSMVSSRTD